MKKIPRGDIFLSDYSISDTINIINNNYLKYKSILEKHYKIILSDIDITLFNKGRCAGQAYCDTRIIRLNKFLLEKEEYFKRMTEEVLIHELCHILVFEKYQGKASPHGIEWIEAMKVCGISKPSRTHNMKIEKAIKRKKIRHIAYCNNCNRKHHLTEHQLSIIKNLYCSACYTNNVNLRRLTYSFNTIDLNANK